MLPAQGTVGCNRLGSGRLLCYMVICGTTTSLLNIIFVVHHSAAQVICCATLIVCNLGDHAVTLRPFGGSRSRKCHLPGHVAL